MTIYGVLFSYTNVLIWLILGMIAGYIAYEFESLIYRPKVREYIKSAMIGAVIGGVGSALYFDQEVLSFDLLSVANAGIGAIVTLLIHHYSIKRLQKKFPPLLPPPHTRVQPY